MRNRLPLLSYVAWGIAIILIITLVACQSSDGNRDRSGDNNNLRAAVVDDFLGEVMAVSDGNDMPVFKGLALLRQDSLGTGTESWSSLELSENRFVLVEENSNVLISQLADDAKNAEIKLSAGKLWVIINDKLADDESFEVVTPTCSLSVRGTVFTVSCDENGGSRVTVYEGTVRFTATDENGDEVTFDITRGAAEVVVENGAVVEIRRSELTAEDLATLNAGGPAGPGGVYDALRALLQPPESEDTDESGNINENNYREIVSTFYNADGTISMYVEHEYDAAGKSTKSVFHNADGTVSQWSENEYNNGKVIGSTYYNSDGSVRSWTECVYDIYGRQTKRTVYNADGSVSSWYESEFNANGQKFKGTDYNANGSISSWYEYEYDADGNESKETTYRPDGSISAYYIYEYSADSGYKTKQTGYRADGSQSSESEYDSNGNQIRSKSYNADGSLMLWYESEYESIR